MIRKLVSLATAMIMALSILSCNMLAVCAAATGISYVDIDKSEGLNVGDTLEALPVFVGTTDSTEVVTYQWVRTAIESKSHSNASANDSRYLAISGATGKTYTIRESDIGYIIKVKATYNGTTVWSGDCVAVGNILSSYSASPATHVLTKYGNSSTSTELVLGTAGSAESAVWAAKVSNSNNADFYTHIATGNSVTEGGYSYHASGDNKLWVSEYTLQAPVFLNNILVETGAGNVYYAIPCVAVNVVYEGETQYKPWANNTASFKTKAQMASDQYNRINMIKVTGDSAMIGTDAGKRISKIQVICYTLKDTVNNRTDSVVIREISGFEKVMPKITGISGLSDAQVSGLSVVEIPTGTTVSTFLSALEVSSDTDGVRVVNADKSVVIGAEEPLDDTMFVELTSATSDVVYYSIALAAIPAPVITAVSLDGVTVDAINQQIQNVMAGTTAAQLCDAITATNCSGKRIVEADMTTAVLATEAVTDTMLVELAPVDGDEMVYYSIHIVQPPKPEVTAVSIDGVLVDSATMQIKNVPEGTVVSELLDAITATNCSQKRVVESDQSTPIDATVFVDDTMFVELTSDINGETVYYSLTMSVNIGDTELINLALAGTIISNGAYTTTPVTNAIDDRNDTAFTSAGNTLPTNPTGSYRPYGEAPIITLSLGSECIVSKVSVYDSYDDKYYTLYYSNDGVTWTEIGQTSFVEEVTLTDVGTLNAHVKLHELEFPSVRARYIKAIYSEVVNVQIRHFQTWGIYAPLPVVTENLAYNKNGLSSSFNPATRVSNMFDLSMETRWLANYQNGENPWASVDLGEAKTVGSVAVYDDVADVNYLVYGSLNGTTWEEIGQTSVAEGASQPYKKEYTGVFEARYIKVVADQGRNISIFEFEVYRGTLVENADDLAHGKAVTSSARPISSANATSFLVDGDRSTAFLTDVGLPYTITVDLGSIERFSKMMLCEPANTHTIQEFSIRVSPDRINWYDVHSGGQIGDELIISFPEKQARYVELSVHEVSEAPTGLASISIYRGNTGNSNLQAAVDALIIPDVIQPDYSLPLNAGNGVSVEWQSGNDNLIKVVNGQTIINQPASNTAVLLTATFSLGGESIQKNYQRVVAGTGVIATPVPDTGGGGFYGGASPNAGSASATPKPIPTPESTLEPDNALKTELKGHWGEKEIGALIDSGIVKGSNGSLNLTGGVTRAEFAAMLVRGLDLKTTYYKGTYRDISSEDWFAKELQAVIDAEIMVGSDGNFRPNDVITREEMAVVLVNVCHNVLNIRGNTTYDGILFTDSGEISNWATESVREAAVLGLINGFETGELRPQDLLNREQAMVVIYRLITEGEAR